MSVAPAADLASILDTFRQVPHCRLLEMRIIALSPGCGIGEVPYRKAFVGNARSGVVHGGVITTLFDTLAGIAVMTSVPAGTPVATLDLRIDYLRAATPGQDIRCRAECYRTTPNIAFVRGFAFHQDENCCIAHCAGTFMLGGGGLRSSAATGAEAPAGAPAEAGGQPC